MSTWGIIKGWMISAGVAGVKDLADRTGIPYGTLLKRKSVPQEFRARELKAIRKALGMSVEDFYRMAEAAGDGI